MCIIYQLIIIILRSFTNKLLKCCINLLIKVITLSYKYYVLFVLCHVIAIHGILYLQLNEPSNHNSFVTYMDNYGYLRFQYYSHINDPSQNIHHLFVHKKYILFIIVVSNLTYQSWNIKNFICLRFYVLPNKS